MGRSLPQDASAEQRTLKRELFVGASRAKGVNPNLAQQSLLRRKEQDATELLNKTGTLGRDSAAKQPRGGQEVFDEDVNDRENTMPCCEQKAVPSKENKK